MKQTMKDGESSVSTSIKQLRASAKKLDEKKEYFKKRKADYEWYSLRHMLGYANWALFYILLGGREAGKSYSVTDFFCRQ